MARHRLQDRLVVRPGSSKRLALFLGLTHALALLAILLMPLGVWCLPLGAMVIASLGEAVYCHLLRLAPWAIREVLWESDGTWSLELVSGRCEEARLVSTTFVSLPLVVLDFRVGRWRRRALPLFADSLDPETRRRLRQRLRIEGNRSGGADGNRPIGIH